VTTVTALERRLNEHDMAIKWNSAGCFYLFIIDGWLPGRPLVRRDQYDRYKMVFVVNGMKIDEKIQAEMVVAMKDRDEHRLTTLRMMKLALKSKGIEKREALTDAEEVQVLTTLIKQRKEFVEAFIKGGRPELAEKEQLEIGFIEAYLPASGEDEIRKLVHGAVAHLQRDAGGVKPGPRDLGTALQVAQQWIRAAGLQADRKVVSEIVKAELSK
jgi:uncharacterized protein